MIYDLRMTKHPNNPTIVFFGTPDYVLPVVEALKARFKIAAVVTQPPKPVGRKGEITPSPVAQWARKNDIPVITKFSVLPSTVVKAQVGVLASYGRIIPKEVIDFFPHGIINIHPSLLPKYRGASPVAAAIVAGEKQTGVTIIKLDEKMDHGPILAQFSEKILPDDTGGVLRQRLFEKAAKKIATLLNCYLACPVPNGTGAGEIKLLKQDHSKATFTTLIKKEHGFIPPEYLTAAVQGEALHTQWHIPFVKNYSLSPNPYTLARFVRATNPWPGTWTQVLVKRNTRDAKRLKILKAHVEDGRLVHDIVQLEGKNPVSWQQFVEGYPNAVFS